MTTTDPLRAQQKADQFGQAVAARLDDATAELPYEVRERLRAARVRALEQRKLATRPAPVLAGGGTAALGPGGGEKFGWAQWLASALPLVVLAAGLVLLHGAQNDFRASEMAAIDQALLTDDLPPSAYADPGFVQFLRSDRD